jgi:hypothetical protein
MGRIACGLLMVISSMVAFDDESNAVNACDTQKVVEVESWHFDKALRISDVVNFM